MSLSKDQEFRIGINGSDLEGRGTGVAGYLSSILRRLSAEGKKYYIYSRSPVESSLIPDHPSFINIPTGHDSNFSYTRWEQFVLPRYLKRDKIALFFSAGNSVPILSNIPRLVAIHDLSWMAHPEWFSAREGFRRKVISYLSSKVAQKIFTLSNFSKSELMTRYGVRASKIIITPVGPGNVSEQKVSSFDLSEIRKKYQLNGKVILYVGLLMERRFIFQLIEAFSKIVQVHNNTRLVLIGNNRMKSRISITDYLDNLELKEKVIYLEYLSDKELASFYKLADLFIYLSEYEGFGIPPLEAIFFGVPVITSNRMALTEIYRDSALMIDNHTPDEISNAIISLLTDKQKCNILLKNGRQLLKRYTWDYSAGLIEKEIDRYIGTART